VVRRLLQVPGHLHLVGRVQQDRVAQPAAGAVARTACVAPQPCRRDHPAAGSLVHGERRTEDVARQEHQAPHVLFRVWPEAEEGLVEGQQPVRAAADVDVLPRPLGDVCAHAGHRAGGAIRADQGELVRQNDAFANGSGHRLFDQERGFRLQHVLFCCPRALRALRSEQILVRATEDVRPRQAIG